MGGFDNGNVYGFGGRIEPSTARSFIVCPKNSGISIYNVDGDPNGTAVANIGSVAYDRTNGDWYRKDTGTGNTGWVLANGAFTSVVGDDSVTTDPDSSGVIDLVGKTVANATYAKPLFINQDGVTANQENWNIQLSTELAAAPADSNDAGICSFSDAQFAVDANGFVTLVGGVTPPALTFTGDDGTATSPDSGGDVALHGVTVANATYSKPVYINQDSGDTHLENFNVQVTKARTGAPSNKNDAGLASFDDTDFTVTTHGYVQLVGSPTLLWQEVAINTNMSTNHGYVTNAAGSINLALPTTAALGETVRVVRKGAGAFVIVQAIGQQVHFGSSATTSGGGGSITSLNQWDAIEIVCTTANTTFAVLSSQGAGFTIV